jgi:hypothetical protein
MKSQFDCEFLDLYIHKVHITQCLVFLLFWFLISSIGSIIVSSNPQFHLVTFLFTNFTNLNISYFKGFHSSINHKEKCIWLEKKLLSQVFD